MGETEKHTHFTLLHLNANVFSTDTNWGTLFRLNWNLEVLVFEEKGKPEYPEKNLLEQGREQKPPNRDSCNTAKGHTGLTLCFILIAETKQKNKKITSA